jgi:cytidylate kinase
MHREFVKNDYFHKLTRTVLSLARQGHAIFLGRGIDLILPPTVGFRVRLVAPLEKCVERYAKLFQLTPEQARGEVIRLEQQRSEFVRHHFGIGAAEPTRNDLVINMARWTSAQAVELILSARRILGVA